MIRFNLKKMLVVVVVLSAMFTGAAAYQLTRPDFKTLDGESHKWSSLQGEWVVINFFAEWCAPCLREVPELNEFNQLASERSIKLFALSFDNEPDEQLLALQDKYDMAFPIISSSEQRDIKVPRPNSLPATYIISPDGEVKKRMLGEQTAEQLMQTIDVLKRL